MKKNNLIFGIVFIAVFLMPSLLWSGANRQTPVPSSQSGTTAVGPVVSGEVNVIGLPITKTPQRFTIPVRFHSSSRVPTNEKEYIIRAAESTNLIID